MVILLKIIGFLVDGVDPDKAQQVSASDLGRHYSLHPNVEIKLDSCFAELLVSREGCRPRLDAASCGV